MTSSFVLQCRFRRTLSGSPASVLRWLCLCSLSGSLLGQQVNHQHSATPVTPHSAVKNTRLDELDARLASAKAAREAGDPGAVANANAMVIASALREMASVRAVEGAFGQAAELYKNSLRFEQTPAAVLALATVDAQSKQNEEAIQLARQVHQQDPGNLQADRVLSSAFMQEGKFIDALEPLSRIAAADSRLENQYALANCLLQTKRPEDKARAGKIFEAIAAQHGDSGSLHVLIGRAYRDAGDLPGAIQQFKRALALDPKTPHAHYFLGLAELSLNEWKPTPEAVSEIQQEAKLYPGDYLANFMTGLLASEDRRYAEAEPYLRAAAAIDPSAPEPSLYLGLNAYAQGDTHAAETSLREAVKLTGSDEARSNYQIRRAYVDLGRILAKEGRTDESEAFLNKARDLQNKTMEQSQQTIASMAGASANPAAVLALAGQAPSVVTSGPDRDETATLNKNASPPSKLTAEQRSALSERETQLRAVLALAYNDLGTSEAVQGHFPEAVGLYRKAEEWDSNLAGLQKNLGLSEFRAADYESAVSPLTQALLQQPQSSSLRAMLGVAYFDLNRFTEAAHTFAPLGQAGMQDAQVGYAWAASLARTGDNQKAAEVLNTYMSTARPPDVQLLAGQLWTALGDYRRATATLQQALKADPTLPRAHLALGLAYIHAEQWPDAAREFESELALSPDNADARYHLGFVDLQENKPAPAQQLFQQVVNNHPDYANAQYQLGKMELEEGQTPDALGHLEAAARLSPQTDYIHYQLQAAYRKAGRTADADRELALYKQIKANAREEAAERVPSRSVKH